MSAGGTVWAGFAPPALFDNRIGRKRNVDGGVLAARITRARRGISVLRCERTAPTVTFPDSPRSGSALGFAPVLRRERVCLGLVETAGFGVTLVRPEL